MSDCLIVGDSIAVGMHRVLPECAVLAKGGINSWQWHKLYGGKSVAARTVIISLGSNDHEGVRTESELNKLRESVGNASVYWVLPAIKPQVQAIVVRIAQRNGDAVLRIRSLQPDKIHPSDRGYRAIAEEVRGKPQ